MLKNSVTIIRFILCAISAVTIYGCHRHVNTPQLEELSLKKPSKSQKTAIKRRTRRNSPTVRRYKVGTSIENRPIVNIVIGQGKEVILIIASVHGNERAGTRLVRKLPGYFQRYPKLLQGRKIVVLPSANPDGAARNYHHNSRGVDLNHNFSTANRINNRQYGFTAFSEPETRVIAGIIRYYAPRRIISLHQPLACIDYDGPGRNLATHMAKFCDLPVCKLGALPGSLGSYAGVGLGIPTITFELPREADMLNSENLWRRYGASLIAAILYNARVQDFQFRHLKAK